MKGTYYDMNTPNYHYSHLLLVEGKDDAIFLDIVLSLMGWSKYEAQIIVCGGKIGVKKHLLLISKSASYLHKIQSISIIRDADDDHEQALREVHAQLLAYGFPTPKAGAWLNNDNKKVGVYLLPRAHQNGDLESLALELAMRCGVLARAEQYIEACMQTDGANDKISKRKIQAYLAGKSPEIRPTVGWAFKDGIISVTLQNVPELVDFLRAVHDKP